MMSKLWKFTFSISAVLLIVTIGCFTLFVYWYSGAFDLPISSESLRVELDGYLLEKYNKRDIFTRFLHGTVFGNKDKYAWYPPRPVPVYARPIGDFVGYDVFGIVTSWKPDELTLRVRSYNKQNLVVRLNPDLDGSKAIISPLDQYGYISSINAIRIVSSITDTFWQSLFCPSDIVAIQVASKSSLSISSDRSPIIPKHVRLMRRLCKT